MASVKKVIGVTRNFRWSITTGGAEVDLAGRDLTLLLIAPNGKEDKMTFTSDGNVLFFTWEGKMQNRLGKHSLILWENYGQTSQRRADAHPFIELVPWSDEESGSFDDIDEETITIESSDIDEGNGEQVVVVDSLESHSTTAALSANQGRILKEMVDNSGAEVWDVGNDSTPNFSGHTWAELVDIVDKGKLLLIYAQTSGYTYVHYLSRVVKQGNTLLECVFSALQLDQSGNRTSFDHFVCTNNIGTISCSVKSDGLLTTSNYTDYVYTEAEVNALLQGKQDTINDLQTIRSGAAAGATAYQKPSTGIPATDLAQAVQNDLTLAASALQDAPSDGKQYARKDGAWTEVEASGGGGSLAIVEVEAGTTAITAEADTYYKVAGQTTNLAVTLPTMDDSTKTARCKFLFTTANNPSVTFGTSQTGASITYFDGYQITGGYAYIVDAEWAGGVWQVKETRQTGGSGPAGSGEVVTVVCMQKSGDSVTNIASGCTLIVTIDGTSTVYTTDTSGQATFTVPYGYTYSVEAARRNGQYISQNAYTQTYTAGQTARAITFVFRSMSSGLFITTADGTDYTLEQWQEAVAAGTRQNSDALYIHAVTQSLVNNNATFLVKIDTIRDRTYGTTTYWCSSITTFNSISTSGTSDYDGLTQTSKVITEAAQRGLGVAAFTRCAALSEEVGGVIAKGFLGAYQQWNFLWSNRAEVDDILVATRPNGAYTLSGLTANKWSSSQSGQTGWSWAAQPVIVNKNSNIIVIPFYSF